MNPRDNFIRTINHSQPERMAIDLGSTAVTGIHIHALSRLRRHYGLQRKPIRVKEPFQMLGEVSWELIDSVGIDTVGIWPIKNVFGFSNYGPYKEWKTQWGQRIMIPPKFNFIYDENDDVLISPQGDLSKPPCAYMPKSGYAFEIMKSNGISEEEETNALEGFEEAAFLSVRDQDHWQFETEKVFRSGKPIVASFGSATAGVTSMISGLQPKAANGIQNISDWYADKRIQPNQIKKFLEEQTEIVIENLKRIFSETGNTINVVYLCGTDFGTDGSSFCTKEQFKEHWLPVYKRLNDWIHTHTTWKTFKHSYNITEPLLDDFIQAGFDIINPVHMNGNVQELRHIKAKYGSDIVFWGCGIDIKNKFPVASPKDIKNQVLRNCEILNKDGGFVFAPDHNIPANTPAENIVAMLEAVQEFNGRP